MKWYCLVTTGKISKRGKLDLIESELKNIFKENLLDFEVLSCDDFEDSQTYLFVKTDKYAKSKKEIINSRIIDVLPSVENPTIISEEEVFQYRESASKEERSERLRPGAVVSPKKGCYKNLQGIVVDILPGYLCKVKFKLYTETIFKNFEEQDLIYLKNIFANKKNPIRIDNTVVSVNALDISNITTFNEYMEHLRAIVNFSKIHRSRHRKSGKQ